MTTTTVQRTPKPPPITPRQLRGSIAVAVIAALVLIPWALATGPLRVFDPVDWTLAGTEDGGQTLVVRPLNTLEGCDQFHAGVTAQYPSSPVAITVLHRKGWPCNGSDTAAEGIGRENTRVLRLSLAAPLGDRGVTGPHYVEDAAKK